VRSAQILAGVLAQDQASSVAVVAQAVCAGVAAVSAGRGACVLILDAGSRDGTAEAAEGWAAAAPRAVRVEVLRLVGPPDAGRTFWTLWEAARALGVSACAYVQADLLGIGAHGVARLLDPILADRADVVLPAYTRPITEGSLTTNLLSPLARALYGKRIQQILGGCGAVAGRHLPALLADPVWEENLGPQGIACWIPVEAMAAGRRIVEAHLGEKRAAASRIQPDLPSILVQTVGPFFRFMDRYADVWLDVQGSAAVPSAGAPAELLQESAPPEVERMVRAFRLGLKDLLPVWEQAMPEETLGQLYPLGLRAPDDFEFPAPLWARVVCDFAVAHHEQRLPREHLLRALTPLYLGRTAAFLREAHAARARSLAGLVEGIGAAFEAEAAILRARWR
jgi:hypothetical protein